MKFSLKTRLGSGWLLDINNNAVGLLVGFIIRGIAAIRAERNTGKVTPPLLFPDRLAEKKWVKSKGDLAQMWLSEEEARFVRRI
jgi:hypothetical protein